MTYIYRDIPGLLIYQDGRVVCENNTAGRRWYKRFTRILWKRARGVCKWKRVRHAVPLEEATMDHTDGRGMGGGRRHDAPWKVEMVGGVPKLVIPRQRTNQMMCGLHNGEKGSRRG